MAFHLLGSHTASHLTLLDLDLTPVHAARSILASQSGLHTLSWEAHPSRKKPPKYFF